MKNEFENVFQFKITLKDIRPPIWRRILVPETYTFHQLSNAILRVMDWADYHLHSFYIKDPDTDLFVEMTDMNTYEHDFGEKPLDERKQKISKYFTVRKKARYLYDFGDDWEHEVTLEKILPREPGRKYPVCTGGKRACPPEDVGGTWGYAEFLEAIKDPDHPEYESYLEWVGGRFDPEFFDPKSVKFR